MGTFNKQNKSEFFPVPDTNIKKRKIRIRAMERKSLWVPFVGSDAF